uniref:Uncharacterized protein n=1 Tax=Rhizophora mucronata TaxID=61149 RepID=A0A2P2J9G6_RHIMU
MLLALHFRATLQSTSSKLQSFCWNTIMKSTQNTWCDRLTAQLGYV